MNKMRQINRDESFLKKNQMAMLTMKNTMTEMKTEKESINSRHDQAEERICEGC